MKLFKRPKSKFYWYDFTVAWPSLPRVNPGDKNRLGKRWQTRRENQQVLP